MKIQKEDKKNIFILALWSIVLFLIAKSFRAYYSMDVPPAWDNLAYQIEAIKIARTFIEGNANIMLSFFGENIPIGYIFSLAIGYILFGFESSSPYIVSALFGFGNLLIMYFLSVELKVRRSFAFFSCLIISTLTNFLYHNFLQTRNDYALSFFIILFVFILIRAVKISSSSLFFLAGVFSGIGTIFKLSAPGYFFWIYLLFIIIPNNKMSFRLRAKNLLFSMLGAFLACGWFFLPALSKIVKYYSMWGEISQAMYYLKSFSDLYLFYLKNLVLLQLSPIISISLVFVFLGGLFLGVLIKSIKNFKVEFLTLVNTAEIYLIIGSYLMVICFLTLNKSYSYGGDTPVISLMYVFLIVIFNAVFYYLKFDKNYFYILIILFLSVTLFRNYKKISNQYIYPISEFTEFVSKTKQFRNKYLLNDVKFVQMFSHPVYNSLAVIWNLHLTNQERVKDLILSTPSTEESFFLDHSQSVPDLVKILSTYPFLILPGEDPIQHGGEYFSPINIHSSEIKDQILKSGIFECEETFTFGKKPFPLNFCLSKSHRTFKFSKFSGDGWLEWGSNATFFSVKDVVLKMSVNPLRIYKTFYLLDMDDNKKYFAKLTALASSTTQYEYEIRLPGKKTIQKFQLLADPNEMSSASSLDPRKLAFTSVYTSLIEKY